MCSNFNKYLWFILIRHYLHCILEPTTNISKSADLEPDDDFFFSNDPAVEALLEDVNFSPQSEHGDPNSPQSSSSTNNQFQLPPKRPCRSPDIKSDHKMSTGSLKRSLFQPASSIAQQSSSEASKPSVNAPPAKETPFKKPLQINQPSTSTSLTLGQKSVKNALQSTSLSSSQSDIRRYIGLAGPQKVPITQRSGAGMEAAQNPTPPFAYLQVTTQIWFK